MNDATNPRPGPDIGDVLNRRLDIARKTTHLEILFSMTERETIRAEVLVESVPQWFFLYFAYKLLNILFGTGHSLLL